jgi:hypothetical protein
MFTTTVGSSLNGMSVALPEVQAPHETPSGIRQGVHRIELRHETSDSRIVNGSDQASDIDLRKVEVHGSGIIGCHGSRFVKGM